MKEFLEALRTINFADILRIGAIITPIAAAIWAAIHWSYKIRLESLEMSLKLIKDDRDLQLKRALDKQASEHAAQITKLESEITTLTGQVREKGEALSRLREDFATFHELAVNPTQYKDELWQAWLEFDEKYFHVRASQRKEMLSTRSIEYGYEERKPRWFTRHEPSREKEDP